MISRTEKKNPKDNCIYSREKFQEMVDNLDDDEDSSTYMEETGKNTDKKRRLSYTQVKALENIFEVDTKLESGKKVTLAHELGLQPRQVAIWFQNRRARWKTKQLERDYNRLKASYESLELNYSKLEQNKNNLIAELTELKAKVEERNQPNLGLQSNGLSKICLESSRADLRDAYQQQWTKMEEGCFFDGSEESCNIFSVDQAPNLHHW